MTRSTGKTESGSSAQGPKFIVSVGAGSPRKPAIVAPDGRIVAVASSHEDAAQIVAALNGEDR